MGDEQVNLAVLEVLDGHRKINEKTTAEKMEEAKLVDFAQNTKLRRHFAWGVFAFVCGFTLIMFGFLRFYFVTCRKINIGIPPAVIITLISTSFIEVLGLMTIVLLFIFPKEKKPKNGDWQEQ